MRFNMFFAIELLSKAKSIQRADHRPRRDDVGDTGVDLGMVRQKQRRIRRVARPQCAEHHLMAAAGIAERSDCPRAVKLGGVRLEPANCQIYIADRSGISRLRRLAEIDRRHNDAFGRQRAIDANIVSPITVVPRAAMHIDDAGKRSAAFGLINASEPRFSPQPLILDIPLFDFVFVAIGHGENLLPHVVALQVSRSLAKRNYYSGQLTAWLAILDSSALAIIMVVIEVIMNEIFKYVPITKAKNDLLDLIRQVENVDESVAVTKNGVPTAVILSMEKYTGLIETLEILSDAGTAKSLRPSVRQARKGKWLRTDEVFRR